MRHSAGANLASLNLLFEIIHGDIHPEVAVKVDDDGVDATDAVEDSSQIIVVADLRGPLLTLQSELLADELIGESLPVVVGISHVMGVEVTGGTTELRRYLAGFQCVELFGEAIDINLYLLTQPRGRCGLTMGLGEHRHILPLLGIGLELGDKLLYMRIEHIVKGLLEGQRHGGVVDIL